MTDVYWGVRQYAERESVWGRGMYILFDLIDLIVRLLLGSYEGYAYQFCYVAKLVVKMLFHGSPETSDISRPVLEQTVGNPGDGAKEGVRAIFLILNKHYALFNNHVHVHGVGS
jgi:hypothetical protein